MSLLSELEKIVKPKALVIQYNGIEKMRVIITYDPDIIPSLDFERIKKEILSSKKEGNSTYEIKGITIDNLSGIRSITITDDLEGDDQNE